MLRLFFILVFSTCVFNSFSQNVFKGKVIDSLSGVPNASVTIVDSSGIVLFYAITTSEGSFEININDSLKKNRIKFLDISAIGYVKHRSLFNESRNIFTIAREYSNLDSVEVIGNQRIRKVGDTTIYNVSKITTERDKSIGDVISKIPGIAVMDDGRIHYNGEEIKGLHIQGDNIFEERYNLGTHTISKDMIENIEIIQHFQPIRALAGKITTKDVAINLTLKDPNSTNLTGNSEVGLGLKRNYLLSAHGMVFRSKVKSLTKVDFNSTGNGLANVMVNEIFPDGLLEFHSIPEKYKPDSRNYTANHNILFNLKDTLQVKGILSYGNIDRRLSYNSIFKAFAGNDSIFYYENHEARKKRYEISGSLVAERNKQKTYLSNYLNVKGRGSNSIGDLNFNGNKIGQRVHFDEGEIINRFYWLPASGRLKSLYIILNTSLTKGNQWLVVDTGMVSDLVNKGKPFNSARQLAYSKNLTNNFSINFNLKEGKFINYFLAFGHDFQFYKLETDLLLTQFDNSVDSYDGGKEPILFSKNKEFFKLFASTVLDKWKAGVNLPVIFQQVRYQPVFREPELRRDVFVNPNLFISYNINSDQRLELNYERNNILNADPQLYDRTVLQNYMQVVKGSGHLQQVIRERANLGFNYSNAVKMYHFHTGVFFSNEKHESVESIHYKDDIISYQLLHFKHSRKSIGLKAEFSKFFIRMRTKTKFTVMYNSSKFNQFLDNLFLPFLNNNFVAGVSGEYSLGNFYLEYNGTVNQGVIKSSENKNRSFEGNKFTTLSQNLEISWRPALRYEVSILSWQQNNFHDSNVPKSFYFTDLLFSYFIKSRNNKLELEINNLFNYKRFSSYYIYANQFKSNNVKLKGRFFLIKYSFSF